MPAASDRFSDFCGPVERRDCAPPVVHVTLPSTSGTGGLSVAALADLFGPLGLNRLTQLLSDGVSLGFNLGVVRYLARRHSAASDLGGQPCRSLQGVSEFLFDFFQRVIHDSQPSDASESFSAFSSPAHLNATNPKRSIDVSRGFWAAAKADVHPRIRIRVGWR